MKSSNIGLRIVEVIVLGGLFFATVAPLFSGEEEPDNSRTEKLSLTEILAFQPQQPSSFRKLPFWVI